jgi:hypothetical protein
MHVSLEEKEAIFKIGPSWENAHNLCKRCFRPSPWYSIGIMANMKGSTKLILDNRWFSHPFWCGKLDNFLHWVPSDQEMNLKSERQC